MTDNLTEARSVPPGQQLIERLVSGDLAHAAALLAPSIDFKALTPPRLVEADDRAAAAVLAEWFPPGRIEALEMLDGGGIGDRQRVSYRVRWTDALARGARNREIADTLGISAKTVSSHLERIYVKAGVTTRAAATLFAMRHGLLSLEAGES